VRVVIFAVPFLALVLSACAEDREPVFGPSTYAPPRPLARRVAPKPAPKPHIATAPGGPQYPLKPVAPGGPQGPLIVARVGSYMDALEADLRRHMHGKGITVARQGDDITVVVRDDRLFSVGGVLAGDDVLEPLGAVLDGYIHTKVTVNGFTDTSGTPARNIELSQQRARQIADALTHEGVAPERITWQGLGESRLRIATGDNRKEPRNRRIEISLKARPQSNTIN
jgi:outer membrane protein OmpA-like peptidoglycan-associated protein